MLRLGACTAGLSLGLRVQGFHKGQDDRCTSLQLHKEVRKVCVKLDTVLNGVSQTWCLSERFYNG